MTDDQEPDALETSDEAVSGGAGSWDDLQYGFSGDRTTKLDERGRLKMPAEFKGYIERKYGRAFNAFYITSMEGDSAEIYPMPEWVKREAKILALPQTHKARKALLERYHLWGGRSDMDPQGRVQIPEELRAKADLVGDVKVSGEGNLLRVKSVQKLRESVEQNELTPEMLDSLSEHGL